MTSWVLSWRSRNKVNTTARGKSGLPVRLRLPGVAHKSGHRKDRCRQLVWPHAGHTFIARRSSAEIILPWKPALTQNRLEWGSRRFGPASRAHRRIELSSVPEILVETGELSLDATRDDMFVRACGKVGHAGNIAGGSDIRGRCPVGPDARIA